MKREEVNVGAAGFGSDHCIRRRREIQTPKRLLEVAILLCEFASSSDETDPRSSLW